MRLDTRTRARLAAIYEEVMWLARRTDVSPSAARAWYTHITSNSIRRSVRRFSGKVSEGAARSKSAPLRLEHYKRIQMTLTNLVDRHLKNKKSDAREFIRVVAACECVHIVTLDENYSAMRAKGNYRKAGKAARVAFTAGGAARSALEINAPR